MNQTSGWAGLILGRVLLPSCGAIGGILVLSFSPPADSGACKDLGVQVASLERQVNSLGGGFAPPLSPSSPSAEPAVAQVEAAKLAEEFRARAKEMKEQLEASRAKREERDDVRIKTKSEVELVKLRNFQRILSLDDTRENVARRMKRLGLGASDVTAVSTVGAPYIRERSALMIQILERVSSGAKVSRKEIDAELRPIDDRMVASLPSGLDASTRGAIATELRSMVDVPYFLRE